MSPTRVTRICMREYGMDYNKLTVKLLYKSNISYKKRLRRWKYLIDKDKVEGVTYTNRLRVYAIRFMTENKDKILFELL